MTSTIKVDNIQNQCGGAVVTKCGATTTISGSVVKADDIQAADGGNLINQCGTTITLGASGDTINLASGASQTGFGRTGTVDWDTTAKTASFTAVSGDGYFVNTTSSAITVTLPAGSAGSIVSLKDYANTWDTNNVTVTPNGTDKINGTNADATLNTEDQSVTLVYVDSTKGWRAVQDSTSSVQGAAFITATGGTITTSGNCKIHTFTGPGTFTVSEIGTAENNVVSYLVVAGGGGGGKRNAFDGGGGAGAGGFREYKSPVTPYTASPLDGNPGGTSVTVTATAFPITVGAGGAPGNGSCTATNGGNSIFSTITSTGGGDGGEAPGAASSGGSGGGGGGGTPAGQQGSGNTPPVSPPQGNPGGDRSAPPSPSGDAAAGGGGGATAAGEQAPGANAGGGGAGATTSISGSPVAYAGGGGGGSAPSRPNGPGAGGTGGGGNGCGSNGGTNTGGGAGGSQGTSTCGGTGGSGIVVIRYKFQ